MDHTNAIEANLQTDSTHFVKKRKDIFESLINLYSTNSARDQNVKTIEDILLKSQLSKSIEHDSETVRCQISKSIGRWKLKEYHGGEFVYHFGEDANKVHLVIKGEAVQLKPKSQIEIDQEIKQNEVKLKVIKMFQRRNSLNFKQTSSLQKRNSLYLNNNNNNNIIQKKQNDDQYYLQDNDINSEQLILLSNAQDCQEQGMKETDLEINKCSDIGQNRVQARYSNFIKYVGFKRILRNQEDKFKDQKQLYFDEATLTCKFMYEAIKKPGDLFGEQQISTNKCRVNTVIAQSESKLFVIELTKTDFIKLFLKSSINNRIDFPLPNNTQTDQQQELFEEIFDESSSLSEIKKFMSFFKYCKYYANSIIWKKNEIADKILIVLSGKIELSDTLVTNCQNQQQFKQVISSKSPQQRKKRVVLVSERGSIIGDQEIIDRVSHRAYEAKAIQDTECYFIHIDYFNLCNEVVPNIIKQIKYQSLNKKSWINYSQHQINSSLNKFEKKQQKIIKYPESLIKNITSNSNSSLDGKYSANEPNSKQVDTPPTKKITNLLIETNKKQALSKILNSCPPSSNNEVSSLSKIITLPNCNYFGSSSIPREQLQVDIFKVEKEEQGQKRFFKSPSKSLHNEVILTSQSSSNAVTFSQHKYKIASDYLNSPSNLSNQNSSSQIMTPLQLEKENNISEQRKSSNFNTIFNLEKDDDEEDDGDYRIYSVSPEIDKLEKKSSLSPIRKLNVSPLKTKINRNQNIYERSGISILNRRQKQQNSQEKSESSNKTVTFINTVPNENAITQKKEFNKPVGQIVKSSNENQQSKGCDLGVNQELKGVKNISIIQMIKKSLMNETNSNQENQFIQKQQQQLLLNPLQQTKQNQRCYIFKQKIPNLQQQEDLEEKNKPRLPSMHLILSPSNQTEKLEIIHRKNTTNKQSSNSNSTSPSHIHPQKKQIKLHNYKQQTIEDKQINNHPLKLINLQQYLNNKKQIPSKASSQIQSLTFDQLSLPNLHNEDNEESSLINLNKFDNLSQQHFPLLSQSMLEMPQEQHLDGLVEKNYWVSLDRKVESEQKALYQMLKRSKQCKFKSLNVSEVIQNSSKHINLQLNNNKSIKTNNPKNVQFQVGNVSEDLQLTLTNKRLIQQKQIIPNLPTKVKGSILTSHQSRQS